MMSETLVQLVILGNVPHQAEDYSRLITAVKQRGNDPSVVYARFDGDGCLRHLDASR